MGRSTLDERQIAVETVSALVRQHGFSRPEAIRSVAAETDRHPSTILRWFQQAEGDQSSQTPRKVGAIPQVSPAMGDQGDQPGYRFFSQVVSFLCLSGSVIGCIYGALEEGVIGGIAGFFLSAAVLYPISNFVDWLGAPSLSTEKTKMAEALDWLQKKLTAALPRLRLIGVIVGVVAFINFICYLLAYWLGPPSDDVFFIIALTSVLAGIYGISAPLPGHRSDNEPVVPMLGRHGL